MNTSVVWTGSRLIFIQPASMSYNLGLTVIPPGAIRLACWRRLVCRTKLPLLASLWARIPVASLPHAERFELDEVNRAAKRINQGVPS